MIILFLLIPLMCFIKLKPAKPLFNGFNDNYISLRSTQCINGIFILLVFLSHARNRILTLPSYTSDPLNSIYGIIQDHLGQSIVITFLFFSGFGVMESIKKKGAQYVSAMPSRRIGKTLLHFDIAVLMFLFLDLIFGHMKKYTVAQVLLSFVAWESVGNSNWYIFAVLLLYVFTFISFKFFKNNYALSVAGVSVLTAAYMIVLSFFKDSWWYDTVILYPLGMWYSLGKERVDSVFKRKPIVYYIAFVISAAAFCVCHVLRGNFFCYELSQIALMAVILLITMKLRIGNNILEFFGRHLFEIYILMMLPMTVLEYFNITNTYIYVIVSFSVTVVLAVLFKKLLAFIDGKIFSH